MLGGPVLAEVEGGGEVGGDGGCSRIIQVKVAIQVEIAIQVKVAIQAKVAIVMSKMIRP